MAELWPFFHFLTLATLRMLCVCCGHRGHMSFGTKFLDHISNTSINFHITVYFRTIVINNLKFWPKNGLFSSFLSFYGSPRPALFCRELAELNFFSSIDFFNPVKISLQPYDRFGRNRGFCDPDLVKILYKNRVLPISALQARDMTPG